jgi:hypothetical protein
MNFLLLVQKFQKKFIFKRYLRRLVASVLPMLYAEDVGGPGQAPRNLNLYYYSSLTSNRGSVIHPLSPFGPPRV